ncbi:adenine deaminase C-terminal domain-containing protein [Schleiferilactobacillus shenzhenensis]|uniref:Adenine deaminase n=1 Tax=Schleiferilactobacillus shenzhenensis LY-73 TaxID=1231336 RepID=U4TNH1_9LACO|nr:adenine deaminase C-terminal domain-containing protein [Schleiferilactobacillus shenzhenensis]ERL64975.1 Ade [Schleiferilactobacillus shenzhenensis LY-73]
MTTVDLLLTNGHVFNSALHRFIETDVTVLAGKFYWLPAPGTFTGEAKKTIDLAGTYMIPGLVDSHMHIESSMTTPTRFGRAVASHGTTTVIADAHEITNVAGLAGLQEFMAQPSDIDIFYAIPSSVPSTNPEMETTGGIIGVKETKDLLQDPRIICLGEAMNFKGITSEPDSLIRQLIAVCREERPTMPLEGHCPKFTGEDLAKFIYAGITSDHTQQTPASIVEKVTNGMFVQLQKKSLTAENIAAVKDNHLFENVGLVTDDVMADDLRHGHLNKIVQEAIRLGLDPVDAIYMSTYTPARHMGLWDRGAIAPGRVADFIILRDPEAFDVVAVYKNGVLVDPAKDTSPAMENAFSADLRHSVQAQPLQAADFQLKAPADAATVTANVIEIAAVGTFTKRIQVKIPVKDGLVQWQKAGLALLMIQERYGHGGHISFGLVKGALDAPGAVGATWAHDHHNVMMMGTDVADMVVAQNELIAEQGGYVVAANGQITANAPLPIGGVVSDAPIPVLGQQIADVRQAMQKLGYHNTNEIMSFSTLSLLVSPAFKMSDKGLFDVVSQEKIPLFTE